LLSLNFTKDRMKKLYKKRDIYINKIKPFVNKDIIKVLIGQRRVGKSYLMYIMIDYIKELDATANIIYINLELIEFENIKSHIQLHDYIKSKSSIDKLNYVFIDEIQMVIGFELTLKSLLSEGGFDLYCTGSNANLLSGELATYLSGRYIEIKVFPLSFKEFILFHDLKLSDETLNKYLKFGGLPYLRNLELQDEVVFDYLRNVGQAILFKDVVARYNIRNIEFLSRLIRFLAEQIGSIFSARSIVKFLKSQGIQISLSAVLDYMYYISNALLISKVSRTDIMGKKNFEVGEKYYFTDIGLRNSILGFSPFHLGQIIENTVYNHLILSGYTVVVGFDGNKEIDFIAEKSAKKVYIQVALRISEKTTQEREFGNLLEIKDNFPKMLVTLDDYIGESYLGIEHVPLIRFLTEFE